MASKAQKKGGKIQRQRQFWIKERYNYQLGTYYVACGQLSKTKAKAKERSLYGHNVMHGFDSEKAYIARLKELRKSGENVHMS